MKTKNSLMKNSWRSVALLALLFVGLATMSPTSRAQNAHATYNRRVTYNTLKIDGLEIFYREAGDPSTPTILLLHGFPTSSHMFRNLIPLLADKYHVVAPDYPGFGYSSAPKASEINYTFDNLASVVEKFTVAKGLKKYSLYVQDSGAPVGYRLAVKDPERVQALIVQNGNAYEEGLRGFTRDGRSTSANTNRRRSSCGGRTTRFFRRKARNRTSAT